MTPEEERTAMKDPNHLKRWLMATGRQWMLFSASDLVDSLPWPDGVNALMQVIACYRDHRRVLPSGLTEVQKDPDTGESVLVHLTKTEMPTIEELDRAIRYLIGQASQMDPTWRLENTPL